MDLLDFIKELRKGVPDIKEDIPEKVGFFSRGILIRSNVPGVPSGIRYQGFGMKKALDILNRLKKEQPEIKGDNVNP